MQVPVQVRAAALLELLNLQRAEVQRRVQQGQGPRRPLGRAPGLCLRHRTDVSSVTVDVRFSVKSQSFPRSVIQNTDGWQFCASSNFCHPVYNIRTITQQEESKQ